MVARQYSAGAPRVAVPTADQRPGDDGHCTQPRSGMPPSSNPNTLAHDSLLLPLPGLPCRTVSAVGVPSVRSFVPAWSVTSQVTRDMGEDPLSCGGELSIFGGLLRSLLHGHYCRWVDVR